MSNKKTVAVNKKAVAVNKERLLQILDLFGKYADVCHCCPICNCHSRLCRDAVYEYLTEGGSNG